jgi:4-hydroxybenzoate polyprenyltransferase
MNPIVKDWLTLCRISNVPSVMSSVAVVGLSWWRISSWWGIGGSNALHFLGLLLGIVCIYMSGFIFNDVFDRAIDAVERPDRPIPSGRITVKNAVCGGLLLIGLGLFLIYMTDRGIQDINNGELVIPFGFIAAVLLVALMLLYNRFHNRSAWWVFAMAGCRVLVYFVAIGVLYGSAVYITGITSFFEWLLNPLLLYILVIFFYVAGFSRIARNEVGSAGRERKYCYHCGVPQPKSTNSVCSECGRALDPKTLALTTAPPLPPFTTKLCLAATIAPVLVLSLLYIVHVGFLAWFLLSGDPIGAPYLGVALSVVVLMLTWPWFLATRRLYLTTPSQPKKPILRWIASISILDAVFAFTLGIGWPAALFAMGCFIATRLAHRRIAGT